jgi:hypothetical protein
MFSYLIEDDESWETHLGFTFDDPYVVGGDYSTYEFMVLASIASTLGISTFDIETVSIGDDGSGNLQIVVSFVTSFELTATDTANIVAAFFAFGMECLADVTDVADVLAGIEMLYVSTTQLTVAQRQLCIVQYFSNYAGNTITQWQDDSAHVNYYVVTTRAEWVRESSLLPYIDCFWCFRRFVCACDCPLPRPPCGISPRTPC